MNQYRYYVRNEPDYVFKILMTGDESIGKSSILQQYTDNTFLSKYVSTIGVDFRIKHTVFNDKHIKLQIWDTAGQERFKSLTSSYYRYVNGIILAYDISNRKSFLNIDKWIKDINDFTSNNTYVILVGNKSDCHNREVSIEEGMDKACELNIPFVETSAKDNINIEKCFEILIDKLSFVVPNVLAEKIQSNIITIDKSNDAPDDRYFFKRWCKYL